MDIFDDIYIIIACHNWSIAIGLNDKDIKIGMINCKSPVAKMDAPVDNEC